MESKRKKNMKVDSVSDEDSTMSNVPSYIQQGNNSEIIIACNNTREDNKPDNDYLLLKSEIKQLKDMMELKDKEHKLILRTKDDEIKVLKETIETLEKAKRRIGYTK